PRLAPLLPVAIPTPLGQGTPGEGYPCPWSVYTWLKGENPRPGYISEPAVLAQDLAAFIIALRGLSIEDAPLSQRGSRSLAMLDTHTRAAIAQSQHLLNINAVTAAWEVALQTPEWRGPAVWFMPTCCRETCSSGVAGLALSLISSR
ncbi:MAG: hypothetical protein HC828_18660, partial [Blastochloris sp.]|nr:hypothetical protein [Blastochloris sp.]